MDTRPPRMRFHDLLVKEEKERLQRLAKKHRVPFDASDAPPTANDVKRQTATDVRNSFTEAALRQTEENIRASHEQHVLSNDEVIKARGHSVRLLRHLQPAARATSPVTKPAHYNQGGVEAIDSIKAALGTEGFLAYCHGNAMKYLLRAKYKGNYVQDMQKASTYIRWAIGGDPRETETGSGAGEGNQ